MQIDYFNNKDGRMSEELDEVMFQLRRAENTHDDLKAQINIFNESSTLKRDLKSRYNYKQPDEKMLIIIPDNGASSSQR